jgi:hypothetical protein
LKRYGSGCSLLRKAPDDDKGACFDHGVVCGSRAGKKKIYTIKATMSLSTCEPTTDLVPFDRHPRHAVKFMAMLSPFDVTCNEIKTKLQ